MPSPNFPTKASPNPTCFCIFFEHIQKKTNPTIHIKIVAFAFSDKGAKILIRLGFKKIKDAQHTLDRQDIYLLDVKNSKEIEEITQKLG